MLAFFKPHFYCTQKDGNIEKDPQTFLDDSSSSFPNILTVAIVGGDIGLSMRMVKCLNKAHSAGMFTAWL